MPEVCAATPVAPEFPQVPDWLWKNDTVARWRVVAVDCDVPTQPGTWHTETCGRLGEPSPACGSNQTATRLQLRVSPGVLPKPLRTRGFVFAGRIVRTRTRQ